MIGVVTFVLLQQMMTEAFDSRRVLSLQLLLEAFTDLFCVCGVFKFAGQPDREDFKTEFLRNHFEKLRLDSYLASLLYDRANRRHLRRKRQQLQPEFDHGSKKKGSCCISFNIVRFIRTGQHFQVERFLDVVCKSIHAFSITVLHPFAEASPHEDEGGTHSARLTSSSQGQQTRSGRLSLEVGFRSYG